ncbi:hypothetical protein M3936_16500 [Sutcliffiella horikoshii]|nr:hypothetical protein [Sutcliffiella horikoshii]MCM3619191.1 hypothetical protein [Sutcliffiella horikoshii]
MGESKQSGAVVVTQLSPSELAAYREKTKPRKKRGPQRVVDWRWPQNRKK